MKKKVLTMLLAVTMSATVGSPVCAADFTSGAESAAEFSESLVSGEGTSENTTDMGTVSDEADVEEKTQRTEEAEEPAGRAGRDKPMQQFQENWKPQKKLMQRHLQPKKSQRKTLQMKKMQLLNLMTVRKMYLQTAQSFQVLLKNILP